MRFYNAVPDKNILIDVVLKWIVDVVVVLLLAVFCMHYFGEQTEMVGNSMSESLLHHDALLVNRLVYQLTDPKRYDVVVFHKKAEDGEDVSYIKRIIGIPGDTVRIMDGRVYINGNLLNYNEEREGIVNPGLAVDDIYLGEEEYFVMGDNWNSSEDSRSNTVGVVSRDEIEGKIWMVTSPFVRIQLVK